MSWEALEAEHQSCLSEVIQNPQKAFLLISEPNPTFTKGRSGLDSDLIWNESERQARGVTTAPVARGGQWTYHGPGQIVCYPIVQLSELGFDRRAVTAFLEVLKASLVQIIEKLEIPTDRETTDLPFGIYSGGKKLVSFGINIQRGVTSHGFALYLTRQTSYFQGINPCGVAGGTLTSLEELGGAISWEDAAGQVIESIKKGFKTSENC